ncbi:unnamed protein product [Jaminaea pallidilutea]
MPSAFKRGPRVVPQTAAAGTTVAENAQDPTSKVHADQASQASTSHTTIRPPTHPTLRPSPFPQQLPLPLFSLGLQSINDVLTGVGLPSGSLALFLPQQSTSGRSGFADEDADSERIRVEAAQAYADLANRYAAAQGIAAGHRVLVIGQGANRWVNGLMGWAGAQDTGSKTSDTQSPSSSSSVQTAEQRKKDPNDKLKVAFRYENMKRIQDDEGSDPSSSSSSSAQPFVHPFDLSTRLSPQIIDEAKRGGNLVVRDIDDDDDDGSTDATINSYEDAWATVASTVEVWRQQQSTSSDEDILPARIVLPSMGSPSWSIPRSRTHAVESYRLLLRIKTLLRQCAWPSPPIDLPQSPKPSIPIICTVSPSSTLLLESTSSSAAVSRRLVSLADGALAFSSFAADPRLRALFGTAAPSSTDSDSSSSSNANKNVFTGSLLVLSTPTMGSLKPPSIRASQLRGMSSSEAGASGAGSENSLGFKVRRKGVKVEVMGRDLVAGGGSGGDSNNEKKAPEPSSAVPSTSKSSDEGPSSVTTLEQPLSLPSSSTTNAPAPPPQAQASVPPSQPLPTPPRAPLKGMAALRARGLQARSGGATTGEIALEGGGGDVGGEEDKSQQGRGAVSSASSAQQQTSTQHHHPRSSHDHAHNVDSEGREQQQRLLAEREDKKWKRMEALNRAAEQDW